MKGLVVALVVLICMAIFIIVVGGLVSRGVSTDTSTATSGDAQKSNNFDCSGNSYAYLLALKEGKNIAQAFWKPGVTPKTLFDVRDFNRVKEGPMLMRNGQPYKVPRTYYEFEVESSTHGGIPIRKRWAVIMEQSQNFGGKGCAIVDFQEAE